jgi:hypothetical protein
VTDIAAIHQGLTDKGNLDRTVLVELIHRRIIQDGRHGMSSVLNDGHRQAEPVHGRGDAV